MDAGTKGPPFAIKAIVICGLLIGICALLLLSLLHHDVSSRGPGSEVIDQDAAIGTALTPRDSTNLELAHLVDAGQSGTTRARALTTSLETADQEAIDKLTGTSWMPQSSSSASGLISAIAAQLSLLRSSGDTPAAVDDTQIAASTGMLWASFHPALSPGAQSPH